VVTQGRAARRPRRGLSCRGARDPGATKRELTSYWSNDADVVLMLGCVAVACRGCISTLSEKV